MSEPFLAEIRIFGFNFPPRGWAHCDGQILPINQNQSLYSLMGTTYGGDGRTTFALPGLRGRTPMHVGSSFNLGNRGGEENHILTTAEIPSHQHPVLSATNGGEDFPSGTLPGIAEEPSYRARGNTTTMSANGTTATGSNLGHNNMQPYLSVNFCIAIQGLFPSRN